MTESFSIILHPGIRNSNHKKEVLSMTATIEQLREAVQKAKTVVFFGGAGVSTDMTDGALVSSSS